MKQTRNLAEDNLFGGLRVKVKESLKYLLITDLYVGQSVTSQTFKLFEKHSSELIGKMPFRREEFVITSLIH